MAVWTYGETEKMTGFRYSCDIYKPAAWADSLHQYLPFLYSPKQPVRYTMSVLSKKFGIKDMSVLLRNIEAKQMSLPRPKELFPTYMGCSHHPATYVDTLRPKALLLINIHFTLYQKLDALNPCWCPQKSYTIPRMSSPLSKMY